MTKLRFGKIRQAQFIPDAKPHEVYRAFLNAKIHTAFTGSKVTGAGRVGGPNSLPGTATSRARLCN